ncbi:MAG: hypothetical protein GW757_12475 [Alphaproteobacteria bacterium]|nr:hypothetical protein [Alphaproteobacteria bacterium]
MAWRIALCLLLVVALPVATITIFSAPPDFSKPASPQGAIRGWLDDHGWWLVPGGFLAAGIAGIHLLPVGRWTKAVLTACYVPLGLGSIFIFTLIWACHCCGGCL